MKKLKQTVLVLATIGMVSVQAHAAESSASRLPAPQSQVVFSQQDIQGLFDQAEQPMQLAALSQTEMKETEGAFAPWAVGAAFGALFQGARYGYGVYAGRYNWNTGRFLGSVATGAAIGAGTGQMAFLASGIRGLGNVMTAGGAIWRGNGAIANWGAGYGWRR